MKVIKFGNTDTEPRQLLAGFSIPGPERFQRLSLSSGLFLSRAA